MTKYTMQPQDDPYIVPVCQEQVEILYEDEDILLVNKPHSLLTIPGKHPLNKDCLHSRLLEHYPSASIIHRLDLDTSGLLIIALNKAANAHISRQFQQRQIEKTYTAVLFGHIKEDSGTISLPIARDWAHRPLQKICYDTGKASETHFTVLERLESMNATRVLFNPITGRSHQLRIHSREINHPILGCDMYATQEAFDMAERLMLHATTIHFEHPVTGKRINGLCPCPF